MVHTKGEKGHEAEKTAISLIHWRLTASFVSLRDEAIDEERGTDIRATEGSECKVMIGAFPTVKSLYAISIFWKCFLDVKERTNR